MEQLETFYEQLLQEASKARFINKIEDLTDEEKQEFIDFFDSHTNAQSLINWQNKAELTKDNLERVVNEVKEKAEKKKKDHDKYRLGKKDPLLMFTSRPEMFDILEVNDKWIFAQCKSHAACNFADSFECGGAGAKWCVGWTGNHAHWDGYTGRGMQFVLAYNKLGDPKKKDDLKYMIQIDPNGGTQAWLQTDLPADTIKLPEIPKFFGLELDATSKSGNSDAVIEGTTYVKPPVLLNTNSEGITGNLKIGKKSFLVSYKSGYGSNINCVSIITIPEGIETIRENCFSGITFNNVTSITLPSTLKKIEANAFSNGRVFDFTLNIPAGVEIIADTAFSRCIARTINFEGNKFKFVPTSSSNAFSNPFMTTGNNYIKVSQPKQGGPVTIKRLERGSECIGFVVSQKEGNSNILLSAHIPSEAYASTVSSAINEFIDNCDIVANGAYTSDICFIPKNIKHISGAIMTRLLRDVVIPESVETISCSAFSVTNFAPSSTPVNIIIKSKKFKFIPSNGNTNISDPFRKSNIASIQIPEDHPYYKVERIGDISYLTSTESGEKVLIGSAISFNTITQGVIRLPDGIVSIANYVLSPYRTITATSIVFPDTLRSIGRHALSGIRISSNMLIVGKNIVVIGPDALPSVNICVLPPNLRYLGQPKAHYSKRIGSTSLVLTNANAEAANKFIVTYPEYALSYNPAIGNGLKEENGLAIAGNQVLSISKLAKGDVVLPNNVNYVLPNAASHATNIKSLTFTSKEATINTDSFESCTKLAIINFPEKVTFAGNRSFMGCKRLTTINFKPHSTISSLGQATFDHCASLDNVVLPEGLTTLGTSTFNGCKSLTQIKLPSTLQDLGKYVFNNTNLCKIVFNGTRAQWLALVKPLRSNRVSDKMILNSLVACRDGFMLAKTNITTQTAIIAKRQIDLRLANRNAR